MTNIKNIKTQVDKFNIADNQSELLPVEGKNERHEAYTDEQSSYVDKNLEKAQEIYTTQTLDISKYPSFQTTIYWYSLVSLPNEAMALVKFTSVTEEGCPWLDYDYFELISYMASFSSKDLKAVLEILFKHEDKVISQEYEDISLENDFEARQEIISLKEEIMELQEQLHKKA